MEFKHKPVLLEECIENLNIKPGGIYVDGTVGGAGHASEIYRNLDERGTLIGFDQDAFAVKASEDRLKNTGGRAGLILFNSNFKNMKEKCFENGFEAVDGILLDLGVSSYQLDEGERGFSYNKNAPLDMRMDKGLELNAEIIVNEFDEPRIKEIIRNYGEEKWAGRIAEFIARERKKKRIKTTFELVDIIKAAIPAQARREGPHPAKRTFQALRIEVNKELEVLKQVIGAAISILRPGGRLCIITFHSLEDRIVKTEFYKRAKPCTCPADFPVCVCGNTADVELVTRKPVVPGERELSENPRARSAKLRVLRKL